MADKFFELSKTIYNKKNGYNNLVRNYRTPLRIKNGDLIIDVYFFIHIDLKDSYHSFDLESRYIYDENGYTLNLFKRGLFNNLPNINEKNDDDENIKNLSIFIKHCYDMIDNLHFNLIDASFIYEDDYIIKKISKLTLDDENKKHYDGEDECGVCYEYVNTKTKCCNMYLCYFCILKVDKCPKCRKYFNVKKLKNTCYGSEDSDNENDDDDN